jgi:DNA-directed RNA polymerase specialized sigma24 family protein
MPLDVREAAPTSHGTKGKTFLVSEPVSSTLSRDEIEKAIRSLSDADSIRLQKVARYYCHRRSHHHPDDLLQEAFERAIDGSRNCPRHVDIVRFLAQAMRSIASDTTKALHKQPRLHAAPLHGDDGALTVDPPDCRPTAEQQLLSAQEAEEIKRAILPLFEDDPAAQTIVEGIMEDIDGEELRTLTDLSKIGFASTRRRIRRRIDKAFPNGWKS